mmetsp:Transcript_18927/g.34238  ORF Transcript_18927/g.34238 Transcript_18927/m.34238 type:complete len:273 (+) Transcript_18927:173-991(+)
MSLKCNQPPLRISGLLTATQYLFKANFHNKLLRVCLNTGESRTFEIEQLSCYSGSSTCAAPGDVVYVAGGVQSIGRGLFPVNRVTRIDTKRDFAVTRLPTMIQERYEHATVYYQDYIYVLGGSGDQNCERYSISKNEWEPLPSLPQDWNGVYLFVVESTSSLFAFGLYRTPHILRLDFDTLTWEAKEVAFPSDDFFERVIHFKMGEDLTYIARKDGVYTYNPASTSIEVISKEELLGIKEPACWRWFEGILYFFRTSSFDFEMQKLELSLPH